MKKVHIKFIKGHDVGIKKGEFKTVRTSTAKEFIDSKHAVEVTEKEYAKHVDSINTKKEKVAKKEMKDALEANKQREKDMAPKEEANPEQPTNEFKEVDALDLEANPQLSEIGAVEGDLFLVDAEGVIVLNDNVPVIKKKVV